ncbi:MAG: hypothetical protein HY912_19745 [Desulfomonile tiedjei]|uniref:Calcium-binding protein n=1 Tax=Desulfomonile tiedjei TaxID=2358 RepID=A0A9D6V574_9BACT|nr:hypothetical protein [Desulfomonile tiedjei]
MDDWYEVRIPAGDFSNFRMTEQQFCRQLNEKSEQFYFWTRDLWMALGKFGAEALVARGVKRLEGSHVGGESFWRYAAPTTWVAEKGLTCKTLYEYGPIFLRELKRQIYGYEVNRRDPLVLDLNGDGVQTTNVRGLTYFDSNGDGFYERTGWVDWHDGLLVMDRNGDGVINDGKELFGDQTILRNGRCATTGFEALADLDSNNDGRIDASDAAFAQLRVLKYSDEQGNTSQRGFLYSLSELGIKSINLNSTIASVTDDQGNTLNRDGSFELTDGTIRQLAEYSFQSDPTLTIATEWLAVPDDIAALADLPGYGTVYTLHQAMVRDSSGQLKSLVEQFVSATDRDSRATLMEKILFKWTGTHSDTDSAYSRPDSMNIANYDDGKIAMLAQFFGESFSAPGLPSTTGIEFVGAASGGGGSGGGGGGGAAAEPPRPRLTEESVISLNECYRLVFEYMYGLLMAQTHLRGLYDDITYTWDEENQEIRIDMSAAVTDLQANLANAPEQGRELLNEFARSIRGLGGGNTVNYLDFRETFIQQDPDLAWVIDTGGLSVIEHVNQGSVTGGHIFGTDGTEAIRGSLTEGDGVLNGLSGDDVIYGTDRDEMLINVGSSKWQILAASHLALSQYRSRCRKEDCSLEYRNA